MHWIIVSMLMFACSVGAYLVSRKAMLVGMPVSLQNFASFIVPLFLYIPLAFFTHTSLRVDSYQFLILFLSAVLFSYMGNKLSLLSIKYAPNPGYSLVLSKSYVVFTTLVAVLFFQSELTLQATLGIVCIVLFSALIMIDKKSNHSPLVRPIWLPLAFGAFFCWGMLAIASKYLLDLGVPIYTRLIISMAIVCAIIFSEMKKEHVSLGKTDTQGKLLFIAMGVLFAGFNYFMQLGYQLAPNIGYINAINASSIALVSIGSSILFRDEFTLKKFVGVIGVIVGLIALVW